MNWIRELTREEAHYLRPAAETPIEQASFEARCSALAAGFCEDIVHPTLRDNAGFQCACICALQNGQLEGEEFLNALTNVPIKDGRGKYELLFMRAFKDYGRLDVWPKDLAHAAKGLIRDGHKIDIECLYKDVMDRYVEPRKPWTEIPSARYWISIIGQYQILCSQSRKKSE